MKLLSSLVIAIALASISLTGCMSVTPSPAEQANFNRHFDAMTPQERVAYMNLLASINNQPAAGTQFTPIQPYVPVQNPAPHYYQGTVDPDGSVQLYGY
jgi:hypothetical protein